VVSLSSYSFILLKNQFYPLLEPTSYYCVLDGSETLYITPIALGLRIVFKKPETEVKRPKLFTKSAFCKEYIVHYMALFCIFKLTSYIKSSISALKCTFCVFIDNKYLFLPSKEPYNAL